MKLLIAGGSLKMVLTWTQRTLFAGAVALLGYCAFVLADAWIFQDKQGRRLDAYLAASSQTPPRAIEAVKRTKTTGETACPTTECPVVAEVGQAVSPANSL